MVFPARPDLPGRGREMMFFLARALSGRTRRLQAGGGSRKGQGRRRGGHRVGKAAERTGGTGSGEAGLGLSSAGAGRRAEDWRRGVSGHGVKAPLPPHPP